MSLTKLQRESAAGLELISICRSVTEDGRLSDEEIRDLKGWVDSYANSGLPAHAHLEATLRRVLADGVVTPEEQREVFAAIEKVLPPDLRGDVMARRRAQDATKRERNRPIDSWDFMVAGCRYEGRGAVISSKCRPNDPVFLVRDPGNRFSKSAVEVRIASGHQIGYVPDLDARDMASVLDTGHRYRARVKKILTGGRGPIPVVVADFYSHDADVDGLQQQSSAPPKAVATRGCSMIVAAALAGATAAMGIALLG